MNNNEMMYSMFLNSLKKMDDAELNKNLEKVKGLLSEADYQKLVKFIENERK